MNIIAHFEHTPNTHYRNFVKVHKFRKYMSNLLICLCGEELTQHHFALSFESSMFIIIVIVVWKVCCVTAVFHCISVSIISMYCDCGNKELRITHCQAISVYVYSVFVHQRI